MNKSYKVSGLMMIALAIGGFGVGFSAGMIYGNYKGQWLVAFNACSRAGYIYNEVVLENGQIICVNKNYGNIVLIPQDIMEKFEVEEGEGYKGNIYELDETRKPDRIRFKQDLWREVESSS